MNDTTDDVERRLGKLEEEVRALRDFQKMVMGAAAAVGTILAFVADWIRKKLEIG